MYIRMTNLSPNKFLETKFHFCPNYLDQWRRINIEKVKKGLMIWHLEYYKKIRGRRNLVIKDGRI